MIIHLFFLQESGPQRELIESQKMTIDQLKQQLEKKDSQLSATKVPDLIAFLSFLAGLLSN